MIIATAEFSNSSFPLAATETVKGSHARLMMDTWTVTLLRVMEPVLARPWKSNCYFGKTYTMKENIFREVMFQIR